MNLILQIDGVRMAAVVGIPDQLCLPAALIIRNKTSVTAEQVYSFIAGKIKIHLFVSIIINIVFNF